MLDQHFLILAHPCSDSKKPTSLESSLHLVLQSSRLIVVKTVRISTSSSTSPQCILDYPCLKARVMDQGNIIFGLILVFAFC